MLHPGLKLRLVGRSWGRWQRAWNRSPGRRARAPIDALDRNRPIDLFLQSRGRQIDAVRPYAAQIRMAGRFLSSRDEWKHDHDSNDAKETVVHAGISFSARVRFGWTDQFQRIPARKRDLLQISVRGPIFSAHAFDLDALADRLREVASADTDPPEPRGGIAFKDPGLHFALFTFHINRDHDVGIDPIDLRQRTRQCKTLGHIEYRGRRVMGP